MHYFTHLISEPIVAGSPKYETLREMVIKVEVGQNNGKSIPSFMQDIQSGHAHPNNLLLLKKLFAEALNLLLIQRLQNATNPQQIKVMAHGIRLQRAMYEEAIFPGSRVDFSVAFLHFRYCHYLVRKFTRMLMDMWHHRADIERCHDTFCQLYRLNLMMRDGHWVQSDMEAAWQKVKRSAEGDAERFLEHLQQDIQRFDLIYLDRIRFEIVRDHFVDPRRS